MMAGRIVDPLPQGLAIAPAMQPSVASAFIEDPIDPLKNLTAPVLIVVGGRDRQLARPVVLALTVAAPAAKSLWLPDMTHVLVDVSDKAGDLAAYDQADRPLGAKLVDTLAAFMPSAGARQLILAPPSEQDMNRKHHQDADTGGDVDPAHPRAHRF